VHKEPDRFVLDLERRLPDRYQVFKGDTPATRIVHPDRAIGSDLEARVKNGKLDLESLLKSLWERGITGLLVEGGAQTISSFLSEGLADRIELFMGNVAFGIGPTWLEGSLGPNLASLDRWRLVHAKKLDNDVWMRFEPQEDGKTSLKP
jgi:diaminohydroxyphosphoribosylaminopyrimidine deaminase/5-amino-6-(5-phosphoribosylamino)uracil reductase